ncbi:MAG: flagellar hook-associated protein FlgK [Burkholderiaceae bacterium]|nr:flagellar hook-associated protein FlgK [Burkholderiaceae bacterium]
MSDLLSIGSSGVAAYQRALSTVSNNIANVGTEGYVRQETALTETMPRNSGRVYLGTGVAVAGIKRAYDAFLEQNLRNSTSELNTQGPMVDYANRVIDIMGSDTVGLTPALDQFFASSRALSADPASTVLRQQFLRDADGVAGRFRELSTQLSSVDTETREAIDSRVADVNTLAQQIAIINKKMSRHALVDRQPPDLLDQRDLLLTKLSELVQMRVTTAQNGVVHVSIGNVPNAGKIVNGDEAIPLAARFDEADLSRVTLVADPYAKEPEAIAGVGSGKLGGLLGFREQVLQPTFEALDSLTATFVRELNQIHANGIDMNGEVGAPLFAIDKLVRNDPVSGARTLVDRASAGIRVAIDDPRKVAAGALFRVIENPNNLSGTDAVLSYGPSFADPSRVKSLSQVLRNNPAPAAGIASPADQLLGQIPIGATNWSLFLDNASDGQNIQVFTRDGRQLLGAPVTDEAARRALLTTGNGFVAGSTYSADYLNKSGAEAYKQTSMFYGLRSLSGTQYDQATQFDLEHAVVPSTIERIVQEGTVIPAGLASIPANRLTINGHVLPALFPTLPAQTIQASDIAEWMNRAVANDQPPAAVNALTTTPELTIDPEQGLYINGIAIPPQAGRSLSTLAVQINSQYASDTNVSASLNDAGTALILKNADGYGGADIRVGSMDGNGDLASQTAYRGKLNFGELGDITIGYGPAGKAGDLALLGSPEGRYAQGLMPIIPTAARIGGVRIPNVDDISANTLTLNGKRLPELDYNRRLKVPDMVDWLNATGSTLEPAVVARGVNQLKAGAAAIKDGIARQAALVLNGVRVNGNGANGIFGSAAEIAGAINAADTGRVQAPATGINLSRLLSVNGVDIVSQANGANGPFADATDLVASINAANAGVTASRDPATGEITLSNTTGEDIIVGPLDDANALGVASGTYSKVYAEIDAAGNLLVSNGSGADISISTLTGAANVLGISNGTYRGTLELGSDKDISFGFTAEHVASGPAELAKLGLRSSVYVDGAVPEDLLVFVSSGSGTVAGSFDASMADPASLNARRVAALREENYDITFTTDSRYQITWKNPANGLVTVLAERDYEPLQGIEYRGVRLALSRPPAMGDTFRIDGNQDGTGDNQNMLDIVALQTRGVVGGANGRTISQAYEEQLGKVGNIASQARIAQDALKVVNDQAIEARDQVSGVSLDSEAADLIRYQQAYQASAKTIQVASDLFDAILQAAR